MAVSRAASRFATRGLAVGSGALVVAAFPEPALWWWAWVALVPVLLLVITSPTWGEAALRGWLAGAGFTAAFYHWLATHGVLLLVVVAALLGLLWVPVGVVAHRLLRDRPPPRRVGLAVAVVPAVWVLAEAVRSVHVLGGPWGVLGLTQWNAPLLREAAALGGVWLLGLLVVAVNVALTAVVAPPGGTRGARLLGASITGALLGVAALGGWARAEPVASQIVRIALVQPGDIADPAERLSAHSALTAEIGRTGGADLVVWGQSSVTGDPARQPAVEDALRRAAVDAGVDVLVNGKAGNPAAPSNTSWLYTPDGVRGIYDKRLLVPFGEYVPLRPVLGWLERFTPATEVDRVPGAGPVPMRTAGVTIGPLISYESAFPGLRRELARLGADLTVVQGSLGTFQGSWLHAQQAAMEAVRAVETGRPAVLGTMSGTSAAFDARGRLLLWEPYNVTGAFVVAVPLVRVDTPYVRVGDWALWVAAVVVGWTAGAAVLRWATRHRTGTQRRAWSTAGGRTR